MKMKKICVWIFISVMAISLTACGTPKSNDTQAASEQISSDTVAEAAPLEAVPGQPDSEESKILIAYFTWAENAVDAADVDATTSASVLPPGNTAQMAVWIQQAVGGDLFSIRVAEPYPADYDACLDRAAEEKAENIRPELIEKVVDIGDYDTVFLGFPNWWYSAPMAVFSFLEENDLTGKRVVLFCSHGTGGLASGGKDISAVLTDSQVERNVLGVNRDDIAESQEKINDWLKEIGY